MKQFRITQESPSNLAFRRREKRIDFILTGRNSGDSPSAIIIELKQWTEARLTNKDGDRKHVTRWSASRNTSSFISGLVLRGTS